MSDTTAIKTAMVMGAGTMGAGIAEVFAKAGIEVKLYDLSDALTARGGEHIDKSLAKAVSKDKISQADADAAKARITLTTNDADAKDTDLVVEAAPENIELKKKIFSGLSALNANNILATNTSSLSVTEIAASAVNPGRVIGLHFFNPPPVMPLLEIVRAEQTSQAVVDGCLQLAERIGKSPIVVTDSPGFASSRLGIILGLEAIRMLETGVASAVDIDRAMKLGYRHPMGPLELTDLVGLDVRLAIADHLASEIGPQFNAPPLLRRLVRAGKLGAKSGEGFYRWEGRKSFPKTDQAPKTDQRTKD